MDKKSTRILLSILHICILGVCILTIYSNRHSGDSVVHVSYDTGTAVTPREPSQEAQAGSGAAEGSESVEEPEADAGPTGEPGTDAESTGESASDPGTAEEAQTQPEAETATEPPQDSPAPESTALYTFRYIGTRNQLNIRSAPSTDAEIVSKVPIGGSGSVLELTDGDWAKIEYEGIVGYCSRGWIELQEITK